jgi:hypothetical protein
MTALPELSRRFGRSPRPKFKQFTELFDQPARLRPLQLDRAGRCVNYERVACQPRSSSGSNTAEPNRFDFGVFHFVPPFSNSPRKSESKDGTHTKHAPRIRPGWRTRTILMRPSFSWSSSHERDAPQIGQRSRGEGNFAHSGTCPAGAGVKRRSKPGGGGP